MEAVSYRCSDCGDTNGWAHTSERFVLANGRMSVCVVPGCYGYYEPVDPQDSNPKEPLKSPHQNVCVSLPEDAGARKDMPIGTGVLDYFPLALAAIARLSKKGNDQHNPGEPLHWARGKSADHWDCIIRHGIQRGMLDSDGESHTAKLAWRALAMLQEEEERRLGFTPDPE